MRRNNREETMSATRRAAILSALVSVPLFWNVTLASAQTAGTAAEARAMLDKAVAALKANQADALAKFPKPDGGFRDRDLYVYCFDTDSGKFTAHINPALMGTDVRTLKDAKDGSSLGQKIFDSVKEGSVATVDYNFPKPGGTEPVPKEAFVTKVGNQGCGVGYYK
jgi:cytochrome c